MCVEHFQQPYLLTLVLFYFNATLTGVFALEMALKLGGVGINGYTSDPVNTFDGVIVITSVAELLIAPVPGEGTGVSALRAFRLLRVFRLVRSWKSLNRLLTIMANAFFEVFPFMLVLYLCIFIFSLVGMQFFGGFWPPPPTNTPPPPQHTHTHTSIKPLTATLKLRLSAVGSHDNVSNSHR